MKTRVRCRFPSPRIRATASLVLSYRMERGTPPKNATAALWPSQNGFGRLRRIGRNKATITVGKVEGQGSGSSVTRRRSPPSLRRSPPGRDRGNGRVARTPHATEAPAHERSLHDGVAGPVKPYSSRRRSKMRFAVCRCLRWLVRSSSKIRSMIPVNGPSFGPPRRQRFGDTLAAPRRQHLAYRLAVYTKHPRGLAGAHPLDMTRPPNPCVQLHPIHPPAFQSEQP